MSLTIGSRSNTNKVEIERATTESDVLTGWVKMDGVGGGNYYQVIDPQALVDALAELFPDVKPSPPRPKVGDRVRSDGLSPGDVRAVDADWAWVKFDDFETPCTYPLSELTVVERGAS